MDDKINRLCSVYVWWNKREIDTLQAITQIRGIFEKEFHEAWLKDQGITEEAKA